MEIKQVVVTGKLEVGLQKFQLDEKDLQPDDLLIETEVSFISAGTELAIYTAADKGVHEPGSWCAYPFKPGYANIGHVLDAGAKHRSLIGKRVFTSGGHASAQKFSPPPVYGVMAEVPSGLSSEEAAAARMAMVSIAGLDASTPKYIRTVVVFGLGMVGNLAAQLFRLTGAVVIGVDPSETRRRMARECGIPHTIGGTESEVLEQVREITKGKMAHVSVDAVGHSGIALQALKVTADAGEVIVLGSPRSPVPGDLTDLFGAAHYRWIQIKGALEWYYPAESPIAHAYTQRTKLDAIFQWIDDGRLNLKPMLTHVLPPEEIKTAYDGLLHKKEEFVGVILRWK